MNKKTLGIVGAGILGAGILAYQILKPSEDDEEEILTFSSTCEKCGLKNEGTTCYLNSVLQVFFNLRFFREIVYSIDSEKETITELQNLFHNLQKNKNRCISVKGLMKSFGWDLNHDAFIQHDCHEMIVKLFEVVEKALGKDRHFLEEMDVLPFLFKVGQMNILKCMNVRYENRTYDSFFTLKLEVRNCSSIEKSVQKYFAAEMMEGKNKYKTPHNGYQVAKKMKYFTKLPPILMIHLERFHFDGMELRKITSAFSFESQFSLIEHNSSNLSKSKRVQYILYAVLVHEGTLVNHGHYYVYVNLSKDENGKKWVKFNDEKVSKVSERDVIEGSSRSVYMLIYIKKRRYGEMMADVEIPKHISDRDKMCQIM